MHNSDITNKKVLSKIIIKLGIEASIDYIDTIKSFIIEKIGDTAIDANWLPWQNATTAEQQEMLTAKQIFNEWYTREGIEIFFDVISSSIDPEDFRYRKTFWLAYVKYIENFKIIAGENAKRLFLKDERLQKFLQTRFARGNFGSDKDQCAFIFKIKDCVFVEFAKKGSALYVYKTDNPLAPRFDKAYYDKLRYPSEMPYLTYSQEGRYIHSNSKNYIWQHRLQHWLNAKLSVYPMKTDRLNKEINHAYSRQIDMSSEFNKETPSLFNPAINTEFNKQDEMQILENNSLQTVLEKVLGRVFPRKDGI